jgi:hypothetical protein
MKKKINFYTLSTFTIIVLYALIQGFRMPNLWSINYYLPSFCDGFYRRALPGTILSFLGELRFNYYTIATIQFFILISLLILIYFLFQKNILLMLIISLYLISPAGAYLFHEVGYIDQLLYLILFISIVAFKKYRIFSVMLFSSSMLIHELTLFTTLPIFFTYIYVSTYSLTKSILYILPSMAFFLLLYIFFQTVPVDTIALFTKEISNSSNYQLRGDFYDIFINKLTGQRNRIYYGFNSLNQIFLLFSAVSLTSLIVYRLRKKQIILSLLVFLTGISPLFLGFFGWDLSRWYFLSFSSLTVITVVVLLYYRITVIEIISMKSEIVLYLIFNMFLISYMHLAYFDGYKPRLINTDSVKEIKIEFLKIPNI